MGKPFRKFSEAPDPNNFLLTQLFELYNIRVVQVAFHKPSMGQTWIRKNNRQEYCYLCKLVVERVSWLVSSYAHPNDPANGKCKLIFSENRAFNYQSIDNYFQKLKYGQDRYNCSIKWDYIDANFLTEKHVNETAIHLADIAASALYRACEPSKHYGMTDDRFQRNLLNCLARDEHSIYGLKFFPGNARHSLEAGGHLDFTRLLTPARSPKAPT